MSTTMEQAISSNGSTNTEAAESAAADTPAAAAVATAAEGSHSSTDVTATAATSAPSSSSSSSSSTPAPVLTSEPETETMTMDDDDFLASLEAYERRGQRSRHSVSDPYIPPPLAAKLARLSGAPPPVVEPPKSPEQKAQESWDKSIGEYKDLKASKGKWRPAKKVWEVPEEALSPLPVSARDTPLPVSPPAAADNADDPPLMRFSPRMLLPVEDPAVSPEAEEQGWMETRLRLGDALTEPSSALSGFAPLNLRGSASAANIVRKASIDDDGQPKAPSSPTSMTVSAEEFESMLLASPVKQARHSEAEHLQLLRAYLADLSAQFYTQSSCGARLVKHSKYGFPKVKVVRLNHETGVLSWGSGDIRIRDLISMKLHRFSGSTLPSNAPTNSIAAAAALAKSLSPASKPTPVDGPAAAATDSSSSSSSSASSSTPSPKAFKASSTAPTASATTPPPPKGHFLFTLTTAARALQLDAPTAFDRELWLLGLYNFHKSFVLDAAAAAAAAAASSKGRAAVPFNALQPVHPLQTINFEVQPTGEMRIKLTKESATAAPSSPSPPAAPLTHSPPLAGKSASLSPSLGSSAALTSEPDFSLNKPWWHPSLMAPPAAAAAAGSSTPAPLLSACHPSASFLFHVSSGRASLIKHSRSGKPKVCSLTISKQGLVSWRGKETLSLCDALDVVSGCLTQVFSKSLKGLKKPPAATACFSILMPARTLDLECYVPEEIKKQKRKGSADDAHESPFDESKQVELERDAWVTQLKRLIASLQMVNAKTLEENVEMHSNPLASSSPTAAAAVAATAANHSSCNATSSPPKANATATTSPPVAAFTFRSPVSPKGASASAAGSADTASPAPAAAAAPTAGWRRSIVSDAPLIIHDSDSDSENDDGSAPKPNGRRAAAGASDSSSDSDSDSDSSSDSELADDDRAASAEERERAYAEARLRLAATAGSKGAPAAVAAIDGPAQEVDDDSDEEDMEEKRWEVWQSDDTGAGAAAAAAAATSPATASSSASAPAAAGSEAIGEDSALASLLRMEPVSAVQVPKTNEQLVAGSTEALVQQLAQRDAAIRELQATVRRLTAQNAKLQAQLEANKVDAMLLSSVLPQRAHARDKRR